MGRETAVVTALALALVLLVPCAAHASAVRWFSSGQFVLQRNDECSCQRFEQTNSMPGGAGGVRQLWQAAMSDAFASRRRRQLELNSTAARFSTVNELLSNVTFLLPDSDYSTRGIRVKLRSIICGEVSFADASINSTEVNEAVRVQARVLDVNLTCTADWEYSYAFLRDRGSMMAWGNGNYVDATLAVHTEPSSVPPVGAEVTTCEVNVHFRRMDFSGGISASILDIFEDSVRTTVEGEVRDIVCDTLRSDGTHEVTKALAAISEALAPLMPPHAQPPGPGQALSADSSVGANLLPEARVVHLQDSRLLTVLLQAGNKFLASNSTNVTTTVANLMQALTGRADALRLDGVDWALYSDHDDYTVTAITVRDVVLGGLQSVTHLGPVKVLGQHTMGLSVAMDSLDVSVTVDVQLNALKTNASGQGNPDHSSFHLRNLNFSEPLSMRLPLNRVHLEMAMAMAVDELQLDATIDRGLQEHTAHCLVGAVRALNITLFNATVAGVGEPQVTAFVSPEMTTLLGDALHAGTLLYRETLLLVLSTVLENEVRAVANEALAEAMAGQNRSGCSLPAGQDPHHYDLEEAADVVRLLERLLGLPPDLATWAPLQRLINGSALREDAHDPLAAESAMVAGSPDTRFLDFGADRTSQLLFHAGNALLGSNDGVSAAIKELTHGTYDVRVEVAEGEGELFRSADVQLALTALRVAGLDTVGEMEQLTVVGAHTLRAAVDMAQLSVDANVSLTVLGSHTEFASVSLEVTDVAVVAHLLLGVDGTAFNSLRFGQLQSQPLQCVLSTTSTLELSSLNVSIGGVREVSASGLLLPDDPVFDELLDSTVRQYQSLLLEAAPSLVQTALRGALNSYLSEQWTGSCPPMPPLPSTSEHYDFLADNEGTLRLLSNALNAWLGVDGLNDVVSAVTRAQSGKVGEYRIDGNLVETFHRLASLGHLALHVANFTVAHLASVHSMELLEPTTATTLRNRAQLGAAHDAVDMSIDLQVQIYGGEMSLYDHMRLTLSLINMTALLEVSALVDEKRVLQLTVSQITQLECWVPTMVLGVTDLALTFGAFETHLECLQCTSPGLADLERSMQDPAAVKELTGLVNSFLSSIAAKLEGDQGYVLKRFLENYVLDPTNACMMHPAPPGPPSVTKPFSHSNRATERVLVMLGALIGSLAAVYVCSSAGLRCWHAMRPTQRRLEQDDDYIAAQAEAVVSPGGRLRSGLADSSGEQGGQGRAEEARKVQMPSALVQHRAVPVLVRAALPVCLLGNVALFLSGHLSLGAEVDLRLLLAGSTLDMNNLFVFSLGGSLHDMWTAGAYFLAVLIGTFSGAWPYLKLLVIGYCWCTPLERSLTVRQRGAILMTLDVMGKWSLIDVYVLVMTMMAFRLDILTPPYKVFPADFYTVHLQVTPVWGLYAFMTAACLSLIMNHVALHYHRTAVAAEASTAAAAAHRATELTSFGRTEDSDDGVGISPASLGHMSPHMEGSECSHPEELEPQTLSHHVFGASGMHIRMRPAGRMVVVALIAASLALLLLGATSNAFEFQVQGLAGLAMHAGDPGAHSKRYTLLSTASQIAEQAGSGDNVPAGIVCIALVYLGFALVMPVLQLIAFLVLWVAPLTLVQHRHMLLLTEVVSAWSAVEVFLVAIVVALLEIGQVSQFMVDDACAPVEGLMTSLLVPYGILQPRDATCFYVQASILEGCYVLLAAVAVATVVCVGVRRCAEASLRNRERHARGWVLYDGTHCAPYSPQFMRLLLGTLTQLQLVEVFDNLIPDGPTRSLSPTDEADSLWCWQWRGRRADDSDRRRVSHGSRRATRGSGSSSSDSSGDGSSQGCPPRGGVANILRRALQSPEPGHCAPPTGDDGEAHSPVDPTT